MSDNLAKLGFKGHDGKAKPGNLDENGNLKVKISGNNLDESDNIKVADSNVSQQIVGLNQSIASLQTQISNLANIIGQMKGYDGSAWKNLKVDSQGRPVLASDVTVNAEGLVVDVGELDITDRPERELGKVSLSGKKATLVTVTNAESVIAGGYSAEKTVTITGEEKEVWIWVNIDQQPWSLLTSYVSFTTGAGQSATCYPERSGVTKAFAEFAAPAISLWVGSLSDERVGLTPPQSISEAREYICYNSDLRVRVRNVSTNIATVTIRVLKVWR